MTATRHFFASLDWVLAMSVFALIIFGIVTMKALGPGVSVETDYFFYRQLLWIAVGLAAFFAASIVNWSFFKTNGVFLLIGYVFSLFLLAFVLAINDAVRGAESWINLGFFFVEPGEITKLILVLLLAKFLSRRHIFIGRISTLLISGFYAAVPALLIFLQPDFGSAAVIGLLWIGMSLSAGIRIRHIAVLAIFVAIGAVTAWQFFLLPYQKARITAFLNPYADVRGSGYHAMQSKIAVGSGEFFGRGIGLGTQSRLAFLPEHETDFIFAAFAEEWGFFGTLLFLCFYGIMLWRILLAGMRGESNFEKLFAIGLAIVLFSQATIHIGMNLGIFPVTGLGMPFASYGGSNLITMLFALGILQSFSVHRHTT